jgi:transcriptional regulator with XRE-family HTH domain
MQTSNIHQGEALKAYAKEKGIIVEALAAQLGISRQTLYQWFKKPSLDENAILRILQKMEPPPPFLLGSTGQPSLTTLLTEIRTVKALLLQLLKKENLLQG